MGLSTSSRLGRAAIYSLIFVSGAAGLIYQVAWHKYLAILLGAQARATAVVLAIFLGGISLGYWVFGRWTRWKRWNLLLAYALVEVFLGFWAFLFPQFFKGAMALVPTLYQWFGLTSLASDILLSIALIGFPTFLMGGTLPLLTQGLTEELSEASRTHARIYGFNTVGACLGCLLAGYVLIPAFDLKFAVHVAGIFNVLVGLASYFLFARWMEPQEVAPPEGRQSAAAFTPLQASLLAVGFLSGFYTIALETVLIRLVGLSTGSSNYNFTLIVSIFIFGLGLGSLLVKEIGKYSLSRLFWNQLIVAFSLYLLFRSGDNWSYWVHLLRSTLRDTPQNFYFYQFLLGVCFFALLAIPIGLCGLTLPLCFHLIKDSKEGLGQRVGQLYGLNTVGSVLGAVVGGYWLLEFIDLDHLFKLCVLLAASSAAVVGLALIRQQRPGRWALGLSSASGLALLVAVVAAPSYSKGRWVQPFRHPAPMDATLRGPEAFEDFLSRNTKIIHWDDGPNTSLGIGSSVHQGKEVSRTILVNGKSDGNTRGDYFTTIMLAHLPALLSPKLDDACIIGFGTGITIGTLAKYPEVKNIDVVEISGTIIKNRQYYDPYNGEVSRNEKVHLHEMDAFRFLGGSSKRFDLVISEPSNPWVAGIENLYSEEFYRIARNRMSPEGVFVQWIHTYSFNDDLLGMVFKTMGTQFPYLSVFQLKGGDLAVLGSAVPFDKESLRRAQARMGASPEVRDNLVASGMDRLETLLALEIAPWPAVRVMGASATVHRLESPKLSNAAAKAFFQGDSAAIQNFRRRFKEFYPSIEQSLLSIYLGDRPLSVEALESMRRAYCQDEQTKVRYLCEEVVVAEGLFMPGNDIVQRARGLISEREVASLGLFHAPVERKYDVADLSAVNETFNAYKRFASPVARLPISHLTKSVDHCLLTTPVGEELYGECLLQKILILETAQLPGPSLNSSIQQYLAWFPRLDRSAPNYGKLLEAKNILSKMAGLKP